MKRKFFNKTSLTQDHFALKKSQERKKRLIKKRFSRIFIMGDDDIFFSIRRHSEYFAQFFNVFIQEISQNAKSRMHFFSRVLNPNKLGEGVGRAKGKF